MCRKFHQLLSCLSIHYHINLPGHGITDLLVFTVVLLSGWLLVTVTIIVNLSHEVRLTGFPQHS